MMKLILLLTITSTAAFANETLFQVARIRNFNTASRALLDIQDSDIASPKSVGFSKKGDKIYINSLEGGKTVVYSFPKLKKIKTILHRFDSTQIKQLGYSFPSDKHLFSQTMIGRELEPFTGKPVEMSLSPDGRYLWIPYYRKSFDPSAVGPSAVSIIDTTTDKVVRLIATGPVPKYVTLSTDGQWAAITNWGDNTISLIDTSSSDPSKYYVTNTLIVGHVLDQSNLINTNRDSTCGFCLRGTVFSPDSEYLFVARMGGGGLSAFHLPSKKYLGTLLGLPPTPRHIAIQPETNKLVISSNQAGSVTVSDLTKTIDEFNNNNGRTMTPKHLWTSMDIGAGARTLNLTSDGKYIFVALNNDKELVMINLMNWTEVASIQAAAFPVGLAISPTMPVVVVTSQGRNGIGGNAVGFYGYYNK